MLSTELHLFFTALSFYTRIPSPSWVPFSADNLSKSARYLPLIGMLVGAVGATVFWLAHLIWPVAIAVLLSMLATIALTGAFHEDGLADSCDGFFGGWTRGRVLAIMKDSQIGTFGVIGLTAAFALKFAAFTATPSDILPWVIIAGHAISRLAAVSFMVTHQYVRSDVDSKVQSATRMMSLPEIGLAAIFGLSPLLLLGQSAWIAVVTIIVLAWLLGRYFNKRLGGYTGDCLGAAQQITEVAFYIAIL